MEIRLSPAFSEIISRKNLGEPEPIHLKVSTGDKRFKKPKSKTLLGERGSHWMRKDVTVKIQKKQISV